MKLGTTTLHIHERPAAGPDYAEQIFTKHTVLYEYEIAKFGTMLISISGGYAGLFPLADKLLAEVSARIYLDQEVGLLAIRRKDKFSVGGAGTAHNQAIGSCTLHDARRDVLARL